VKGDCPTPAGRLDLIIAECEHPSDGDWGIEQEVGTLRSMIAELAEMVKEMHSG